MKNPFSLIAAVAISLTALNSCEELEQQCDIGEDDMASGQVFVDSYNELTYLALRLDEAYRDPDVNTTGSGTVDGATVTKSTDSLILDYGTVGVVCSDNKTRKGAIRAYLNQDYSKAGGSVNGKLKGTEVDGTMLKGEIQLHNNGNVGTAVPEIDLKVIGFESADKADLGGTLKLKWKQGFTTLTDLTDDEFDVNGTLTGNEFPTNSTFTATVMDDLVYNKSCAHVLEAGVMDVSFSGDNVKAGLITVDFLEKDGCNNLFSLTVDCDESPISLTYPFN